MQFIKKIIIAITLLISLITFAQSESTWISKKKDKLKKVEKIEKNQTVSSWIKKKKKENKKEFKKKIKESKTWITKKSKSEKKEIKKTLKKYLVINDLPKADFYIAALVESDTKNEKPVYLYGYVNPDKESETFKFNNSSYFSKSIGFGYLDDGKTTCQIESYIGIAGINVKKIGGEVVVNCKDKSYYGEFTQRGETFQGYGFSDEGKDVFFKYFTLKIKAVAQLANYKLKNETIIQNNTEFENDEGIKLSPSGKYYALLIGNSNYSKYGEWENLKSPKNDITEISKLLSKKYKFEKVITAIDVNRDQLFKKFEQLAEITSDKDYVLIYYSGHGNIKSNQSYWIPVNASLKSRSSWININDIATYIEDDIRAHHIALLVDSCYFAIATKSMNDINNKESSLAYKKLLERRVRVVLASGTMETVEDTAKDKKHSIFGLTIINSLKENNGIVKLKDIAENVWVAHQNVQQMPVLAKMMHWGHLGGDFIFIAQNK